MLWRKKNLSEAVAALTNELAEAAGSSDVATSVFFLADQPHKKAIKARAKKNMLSLEDAGTAYKLVIAVTIASLANPVHAWLFSSQIQS